MNTQALTTEPPIRGLGDPYSLPFGDFFEQEEPPADLCKDLLELWALTDLIIIY